MKTAHFCLILTLLTLSGCATAKPAVNSCELERPTAVITITPAKSVSKMNFTLGADRKRHPSAVETIFQ